MFFVGLLGVAIGSFLNVLIDRIPKGEDIVWKPSYCDYCKKRLRWFELIPLISFIMQRRRCTRCRKRLSWQYPAVALATGIGFVLLYWHHPDSLLRLFTYFLLPACFIRYRLEAHDSSGFPPWNGIGHYDHSRCLPTSFGSVYARRECSSIGCSVFGTLGNNSRSGLGLWRRQARDRFGTPSWIPPYGHRMVCSVLDRGYVGCHTDDTTPCIDEIPNRFRAVPYCRSGRRDSVG